MDALVGGVSIFGIWVRVLDSTQLDLVPALPPGSDRFADLVLWGTGDGIVAA